MLMTGRKTRSVFERYNIVSSEDLADAARRLDEAAVNRLQPDGKFRMTDFYPEVFERVFLSMRRKRKSGAKIRGSGPPRESSASNCTDESGTTAFHCLSGFLEMMPLAVADLRQSDGH